MSILTKKQGIGMAALLLAASTILSRLMGLVRDKVISWQFGAGSESDIYFAAFVVPDILNNSFPLCSPGWPWQPLRSQSLP